MVNQAYVGKNRFEYGAIGGSNVKDFRGGETGCGEWERGKGVESQTLIFRTNRNRGKLVMQDDDSFEASEIANATIVMEMRGIYIECSWSAVLCSELLFHSSIWGMELAEAPYI
ncbi:uncharacterized protein G2W53_030144 [Senna tora]|uniref:Uncharacterized protein n=1 Tax=Senna tora TaxID=362788 RepID=A0A834T690_9FABA|nr:uncharacterized protein G2W53_030144 [Senna tora]